MKMTGCVKHFEEDHFVGVARYFKDGDQDGGEYIITVPFKAILEKDWEQICRASHGEDQFYPDGLVGFSNKWDFQWEDGDDFVTFVRWRDLGKTSEDFENAEVEAEKLQKTLFKTVGPMEY